MDIFAIILTIAGLTFFEAITSIDNAIVNADVLAKMGKSARRWFLTWGLFIGVFVVRGFLPLLIVFASAPQIGVMGALTAMMGGDPAVQQAVEAASPVLLLGGGVFLLFLFLNWLFLEEKNFGLAGERFFKKQGVWFFAVASILLTLIVWFAIQKEAILAFGAVVGSTAFFIVHGFRENAEKQEKEMVDGNTNLSDISKLLYLEVIDATFSVDGVVGAFAFTLAVPLILIGNGIGAFIVREITIRNVDNIKNYVFLKNGAMYSILFLGVIMILDGFGFDVPSWLSPISTFGVVGYFFLKSLDHIKKNGIKEAKVSV